MTPTETSKQALTLDPEIAALRDALRSATDDLIEMCRQLRSAGRLLPENTGEVLYEVRQCVRLAMEAESDLEQRDKQQGAGRVGPDIDLERARTSIRCRLDRLRTCHGAGGVSGRSE